MAITFETNLEEALEEIGFDRTSSTGFESFVLFDPSAPPSNTRPSRELCDKALSNKERILDTVNRNFAKSQDMPFVPDTAWTFDRDSLPSYQEPGCFLREAVSNALGNSEHFSPQKMEVWYTNAGFIIGVTQVGRSFDARMFNDNRELCVRGGGFAAYRGLSGKVFFDNPTEARTVYYMYKLS